MPLDGITLNSVTQEISNTLIGGRIDKIQQPEPDEILLAIRSKGQNHKLLISASANNPRIHLTALTKESPAQAPMFCMLLRKHLGGGRITNIIQPDFERIVEIHAESPNEMGDISKKYLIVEIMGRHSNIILLDSSKTIMDSIRHVSHERSSVREVLPGREYIRPPSQGKISPVPVDRDHFLGIIGGNCGDSVNKGDTRVQQAIYQSYNGVSPVMGSEICLRANVPPDAFCESLSQDDRANLLAAFANLYSSIKNGQFEYHIYEIYEGKKRDLSAIPLELYTTKNDTKIQFFASPSDMIETYYHVQDKNYRIKQKTSDLRKLVENHLERCLRKDEAHQKDLLDTSNKEEMRKYGELLTAYIYAVVPGSDRVTVADFYDSNVEIEIPLDSTLTPAENAQKYFKSYNKSKRAYVALKEQMEINAENISYLDSVLTNIESSENEMDIAQIRLELAEEGFLKKRSDKRGSNGSKGSKNSKKTKPLHYKSTDGFDIYVGKNNTQNDELTLKFARGDDIWLHTKEIAGSHVIIQTGGRSVSDQSIIEGATIAAYHSKGRQSGQVPVDYCPRKQVRKPKGAKPGFVIYDSHKTVYVTPKEDVVENLKA